MFTPKSLDFLFENRFRNSREWFLEHKQEYTEFVLTPLMELASAIGPALLDIDDRIVVEPKVDKTISRIYRDTRFSKDKLLYRDEMWLSFKRDKKTCPHFPEFYFVVMQDRILYGCGYYAATSETMDCLRSSIQKNIPSFAAAFQAVEQEPDFFVDGDRYKRSKYPQEPEALRNWLDRKCISVSRETKDFPLLFSEALAPTVIDHFKKLAPVYRFFLEVEGMRDHPV